MFTFRASIASAALFVLSSYAYFTTLHRGPPGGDASEFSFVSCSNAVPHPPGYPTFSLLSRFASFLSKKVSPTSLVAVGANGMAATFGVLAANLLFWTAYVATDSVLASFCAAAQFSSARLVWQYSIQSEVFSLNNALLFALLLASVRIAKSTRATSAQVYSQAFLAGLCMTNQHTSAIYILPTAVWTLTTLASRGCVALLPPRRGKPTRRNDGFLLTMSSFVRVVLSGLAGLLPYLYIVWAGGLGEYGSWGDTRSWSGFWTHFLRKEYGTFRLFSGPGAPTLWQSGRLAGMIKTYLDELSADTRLGLLPTGAVLLSGVLLGRDGISSSRSLTRPIETKSTPGRQCEDTAIARKGGASGNAVGKDGLRLRQRKREKREATAPPETATEGDDGKARDPVVSALSPAACRDLVAVMWVLYVVGFQAITNLRIDEPLHFGAHERFFIQAHVASFFLYAVGLAQLFRVARREFSARLPAFTAKWRVHLEGLCLLLSLAFAAAFTASRTPFMDESDNLLHFELARSLLGTLPRNAVVLTRGDMFTNNLRYAQLCEGIRRDVLVLDQPMMTYPWFVKRQRHHFDHAVAFPGPVYHPREGYSIGTFLAANFDRRPAPRLYNLGGWYDPVNDPSYSQVATVEPLGPFLQVHDLRKFRGLTEDGFATWLKRSRKWIAATQNFTLPSGNSTTMDPRRWERSIGRDRFLNIQTRAVYALMALGQHPALETTERLLEIASDLRQCVEHPFRDPPGLLDYATYKNLGIVLQKLVLKGRRERMGEMVQAFSDYLRSAPTNDAQYEDIRALVQMHSRG